MAQFDPYEIVAIDRKAHLSILANGALVPWETLLDAEGDEVDELVEATYVVHPLPSGEWATLYLAYWGAQTIH